MYENSSCSTTNWNVVVCTVQLDCSFWYCQFFLPFLSIFFSFHLVLSHPIPFIFLSFWHCFFSFCYSNRHIVVSYCDFNLQFPNNYGLKLNIQETKMMASGPSTSWQIDGETMETGSDYFFGLQNHCRCWLQPWN